MKTVLTNPEITVALILLLLLIISLLALKYSTLAWNSQLTKPTKDGKVVVLDIKTDLEYFGYAENGVITIDGVMPKYYEWRYE